MRALYIHISGLVGLLVFLREVLNYAPIERTILVAATTGLTVYLMLIVGHTIVQQIMAYSPPASSSSKKQAAGPHTAPADGTADDASASEPNAPARPSTGEDAPADEAGDTTAGLPPAAESNTSAPDRAPSADRQDAESSEPIAQTPA